MRDLAHRLGVSISTVSRALNHNPVISEETRERIQKAANGASFIPNSLARGLALKRSQLIGLMVPAIGNPFFAEIARGAHDVAHRASYVVALCDTQRDKEREEMFSQTLMASQVSGMILTGGVMPEERISSWNKLQVPLVLAGRRSAGLGFSGVSVDNALVGKLATELLINRGHKKIAYLSGPDDSPANKDRHRGYVESMEASGLTTNVLTGDYTMESGFQVASRIVEAKRRPTAVFAASDLMAIGLIMGFIGAGVKVPGDVAVVGCDDIPMSALIKPSLTTVRVPMYEIGARAMELLLNLLQDGDKGPAQSILLGCSVVLRESVS
jgi:DNA-binding LacI/PurR family transcriptional regulator